MIRLRSLLFLSLLTLVALVNAVEAAESSWVESEVARARLIAAAPAVGDAETLDLGLEIALTPGWKTYWRSPGDAGVPPTLDWSDSENVAALDFLWPAPERFTLFGLDTFGYAEEVIFPLVLHPERPGEPVTLNAALTYMVCEDICIPLEARLWLHLPAGQALPSPNGYRIERYRARVPGNGESVGLSLGEARLEGSVDEPRLLVEATSLVPFDVPDLIVEGPPGYLFRKPEVTLEADRKTASIEVPVILGPQVNRPLEGEALHLTLVDKARAMEASVVPEGALSAAVGDVPVQLVRSDFASLAAMLGLALLGGLILNLMPCVLPVLSLKLFSVVGQGGRERGEIRRGFLASAAGIVVSFLALAALLIALRAGGTAIGWGLQFQAPLFLAAMAVLMTLFAANLFGFFTVPLPGAVARLDGQRNSQDRGLAGHFLTGFLATLLATPCSAPFLGTAVGFALSHGTAEILAIFAALGVGLALPYLAVALFPGMAQRLPRPGRWMLWLKAVLGMLLVGTATWLILILWRQEGLGTALPLALLLLALLALLAWRRFARPAFRPALAGLALLLAALGVALPLTLPGRPATAALEEGWVAFDDKTIPRLVAEGHTVFVDVTAEWCVTCLANKRLVLDLQSVKGALSEDEVVAMRADWTRPDPAIAAFLERFGRYGIPFNVVFGPGVPGGIPLPELLNEGAVLEALARAGRS
ncbi:MAG TPA: protein-disulfide reductase DsbD domain-containing protein [Kiloniellales bacterium]|nr:protein-disulfide reductase DsbD domain-containing protein [Kiloniellales bacterium]